MVTLRKLTSAAALAICLAGCGATAIPTTAAHALEPQDSGGQMPGAAPQQSATPSPAATPQDTGGQMPGAAPQDSGGQMPGATLQKSAMQVTSAVDHRAALQGPSFVLIKTFENDNPRVSKP